MCINSFIREGERRGYQPWQPVEAADDARQPTSQRKKSILSILFILSKLLLPILSTQRDAFQVLRQFLPRSNGHDLAVFGQQNHVATRLQFSQ